MKIISLQPFDKDNRIVKAVYSLEDQCILNNDLQVRFYRSEKTFRVEFQGINFCTEHCEGLQEAINALADKIADAAVRLRKEKIDFSPFN